MGESNKEKSYVVVIERTDESPVITVKMSNLYLRRAAYAILLKIEQELCEVRCKQKEIPVEDRECSS